MILLFKYQIYNNSYYNTYEIFYIDFICWKFKIKKSLYCVLFMKKLLWGLAFLAMFGCSDSKMPKNKIDTFDRESEIPEMENNNWVMWEISEILSKDSIWDRENSRTRGIVEYDSTKTQKDLSKILDLNNSGIEPEKQSRRQHIQELIPKIKEPIILGDLTQPNVAITIDDGYWVESIRYMLKLFEEYDVKATFFVIWECLKMHPELWRKAAQQWHEICNHTAHHDKYFKTWDEAERFEKEVLWWEDAVRMVLWEDYFNRMKMNFPFFRFPWMHGIRVKVYLDILKKHGYIPIGWRYTENPKDGVVNNGEIFLWHFKDQDMENVKKSLELILKNGKNAETVSNIIFTDEYKTPTDWTNQAKKRRDANINKSE